MIHYTTLPFPQHKNDPKIHTDCVSSWWLNILCAYRDGIVGSTDESLTLGPHGLSTLPLLTGQEIEGQVSGTLCYVKEGPASEMHFKLLSSFGRQIRVLRGHTLDSPYAPVAGIRYDGL